MNQRGFSFPELLVVIGIIAILSGLISVNLLGVGHRASVASSLEELLADIEKTRYEAMHGVDATTTPLLHGIHFSPNQYVLFEGATFDPNSSTNVTITLPAPMALTDIEFPGGTVMFAGASGEIVGFSPTSASVAIIDTVTSEKHTVTLNALGTVVNH